MRKLPFPCQELSHTSASLQPILSLHTPYTRKICHQEENTLFTGRDHSVYRAYINQVLDCKVCCSVFITLLQKYSSAVLFWLVLLMRACAHVTTLCITVNYIRFKIALWRSNHLQVCHYLKLGPFQSPLNIMPILQNSVMMASAVSYFCFQYSMEQHGFWIVVYLRDVFGVERVSIYSAHLKVQKVTLSCTGVN